jgi:8-oxo-dGTP pyrophosphatase MutT (NUDIX family)
MGYVEDLRQFVGTRPLILPGACVLLVDQEGHVLLQERHHKRRWSLPGGLMELGESFEETARREVYEETGLSLGALELLDIFSGKDNYVLCPNGDEVYAITAVYLAQSFSGEMHIDYAESLDMRFIALDEIPTNLSSVARRAIDIYRRRL